VKNVRGRFAPSPTGELHIGGARTALTAWLQARKAGGAFVMRTEDLDGPRVRQGAEQAIFADLEWLGIDWDEGPDVGGAFGPYRQSERHANYEEIVTKLVGEGRAFYCFCSRAEVLRATSAPHNPSDEGPRYPGTCRTLTRKQIADKSRTRNAAVRFRVEPGETTFHDLVHGDQVEDVAEKVGDFVIARADGIPAYQLAVVADDIAMHITHVVRGDDLLGSTARQLLLYHALGVIAPHFAHVPLVIGDDGARLSKRQGAVSVASLRERGRKPEEFVGWLGHSLGLTKSAAPKSAVELLREFELSNINTEPTKLDSMML
jgi:glutamyl-tRNA synthetase